MSNQNIPFPVTDISVILPYQPDKVAINQGKEHKNTGANVNLNNQSGSVTNTNPSCTTCDQIIINELFGQYGNLSKNNIHTSLTQVSMNQVSNSISQFYQPSSLNLGKLHDKQPSNDNTSTS